jgi:four helix bundle protein
LQEIGFLLKDWLTKIRLKMQDSAKMEITWKNQNGKLGACCDGRNMESRMFGKKNVVREKSFAFALRTVRLAKFLRDAKREFVLSKQVLRSGTAIGALIRESEHAQSRADFISKLSIALKEANETDYWIDLLHQSDYLTSGQFQSIHSDIQELLRLLVSIVKSSKSRPPKP